MTITNSKQNWQIGEIVKVGFVTGLKVLKIIPTPGNYAPDEYLLRSINGTHYAFVPHNGLSKLYPEQLAYYQAA